MDLPVDAAISRIANDRVEGVNIFEKKENLQRVNEIYFALVEKFPNLFQVIDVNKPLSEVKDIINNLVLDFIKKRG